MFCLLSCDPLTSVVVSNISKSHGPKEKEMPKMQTKVVMMLMKTKKEKKKLSLINIARITGVTCRQRPPVGETLQSEAFPGSGSQVA